MKYRVERTDTADALICKIILFIAENFGNDVALEKLDYLEESIICIKAPGIFGTYTGKRSCLLQG